MSTVSKIPPAKHGQMIKNPGYSGKTKPIIKIKAIKVTKKGGRKIKNPTTYSFKEKNPQEIS